MIPEKWPAWLGFRDWINEHQGRGIDHDEVEQAAADFGLDLDDSDVVDLLLAEGWILSTTEEDAHIFSREGEPASTSQLVAALGTTVAAYNKMVAYTKSFNSIMRTRTDPETQDMGDVLEWGDRIDKYIQLSRDFNRAFSELYPILYAVLTGE